MPLTVITNSNNYEPLLFSSSPVHLNANDSITSTTTSPTTELYCDMAGYVPPQSRLRWYRDGTLLENNQKYTTVYRDGQRKAQRDQERGSISSSILGVLVIMSPSVEDSGLYECKIDGYRDMSRSVSLTVKQGEDE